MKETPMKETLQDLKILIRDLIIEVGDLKERVQRLELNQFIGQSPPEMNSTFINMELEQYDSIGRIYQEGYHVCNVAYGMLRDDECLFCNAFLNKE